ncbi:MAG: Maf family protein [Phycisphaerales bacterium JB065]
MSRLIPSLILASTSPRRRQLLTQHGYAHDAVKPPLDDGQLVRGRVSAVGWVASLAWLKARAVWDTMDKTDRENRVVLAADTVVHKNDEILGQPMDRDDARRIVGALINGEHRVLTGVCLIGEGERVWFVDRSLVRVGEVSDEQIESYLETNGWRGKAGGYNLHERIDDGWPIEYQGEDTSIMGLPMHRLAQELARIGIEPKPEETA